jgi:TATA-box binding protein (TBP) (component of TFIID and TFIIIB)
MVLTASTLLHEEDTPDPVYRLQSAKVLFLLVQSGRHVLAHEREKAGNGKRFVAVSQDLEVDGMLVVDDAEK